MKLIATKAKPAAAADLLTYVRADGTRASVAMPRQGILPHDLVHCVVEVGCALAGGFTAAVSAGADPDFLASRHLEPTRALRIAESVVEAMQAQLALGAFDYAAFCYGIQTACDARGVTSVQCPDETRARLSYLEACALNERWRTLAPTQSLQLEFGE